ncbi:MAG TPA: sulfatase [Tepidisphaeraceae bacterium]|nr:sulfatase [Tepidisphaeraceae bacterium]
MRILYLDIDSLRPDHLGCYGYRRDTSPNIDRLALDAVRFDNCYVTDAPCLPSRTALWSGRFGIHNGVVNHGGVASEPLIEGPSRGFQSTLGMTSWMACLRAAGLRTATISSFGERHSAWHFYANFNEVYNCGRRGIERADEVEPIALEWLRRNAKAEKWFLHVNLWDPHTPYRTPDSVAHLFKDDPLPAWLTEEVRRAHWDGGGPHSAREVTGFGTTDWERQIPQQFPQQPGQIDSMDKVRMVLDGYDRGVRYADETIGRLLDALASAGVLDETVIVVSADHGENLGELNIYGDHQTADHITCRVPLVVRWPEVMTGGRVDGRLLYHFDFAATMVELLDGEVPSNWDGRSAARDHLVISQGAWSCQRSVRFEDYVCIRSYHDGYHAFPEVMLFDVRRDPHEQHDLAPQRPDLVGRATAMLDAWHDEMMRTATHPIDPMRTVLAEGGPLHARGQLPEYLKRLHETGRGEFAARLAANHPRATA